MTNQRESTIVRNSPIEELDPADQRIVGELCNAAAPDRIGRATGSQEDLGHFYARTQKEEHKELMTEAMHEVEYR